MLCCKANMSLAFFIKPSYSPVVEMQERMDLVAVVAFAVEASVLPFETVGVVDFEGNCLT
jgi:hypothetical protein